MRISVDQDMCCASGNCVFTVPEIFDQDEDGLVVALVTTPPSELEGKVRQAVDLCPSAAIALVAD